MRTLLACFVAVALIAPVLGAPDKKGWSSGEQGQGSAADVAKKMTYGMCSVPQNADAYPGSPQKVLVGDCNDFSQQFSATAAQPSSGDPCGGFTVAFGPLGDLKYHLHQVTMTADWGDAPLTETQCPKARVIAIAWGERCLNDACTEHDWHIIGGPKQRKGKWDAVNKVCQIGLKFTYANTRHRTLKMDIAATVLQNGQPVRKREKGTILAEVKSNKACYSAEGKVATKEKR